MKKSILWTLVLPVPIVVIVLLIGFFLIVPGAIQSRAEHQATLTNQSNTLRKQVEEFLSGVNAA